jgi:hypothetical protein
MNATLSTDTASTTPSARRRSYFVGAAATALAVAGTQWAVLKDPHADSSQLNSLLYLGAAALIVGAALFAWLVPARIAANGTGLAFSIVSVPLLVAYWSALPMLFAVAAILIATAYRRSHTVKAGRSLTAIIIAAVVLIATIIGILFG